MVVTAWLTDAQLPTQNALKVTVESKEKKEDLEVTTAMVGVMEKAMEAVMQVVMIVEMANNLTVVEEEATMVAEQAAAPAHLLISTKSNLKLT